MYQGGRNLTKNKFPRSVSFNLKNQEDAAILKYVKKRNFSGYVKGLILADMRKNNVDMSQSESQNNLSKLEQLRQSISSYTNQSTNSDSN